MNPLVRPHGVGMQLPSVSFGSGYGSSGYIDFSNHPGFGPDNVNNTWSIVCLCYHVSNVDSIMMTRSSTNSVLRWGTNGNRHLSIENGIAIGNTKCIPPENRWSLCGSGSIGTSGIWMAVNSLFIDYDDGNWGPYPWTYNWKTGAPGGTITHKIGSWSPGAYQMNGSIAAQWLWNVQLTRSDWASIVNGGNPERVRPDGLRMAWYAPADVSSNLYTYDRVTGIVGTKAGGSSMSRGPSVQFPLTFQRERSIFFLPKTPFPMLTVGRL